MRRVLAGLISGVIFNALGCADPGPVHHYHPATALNEKIQVEQGMPMHDVKQQDFFFKKCELSNKHPQFDSTEFQCTDLH